VVLNTGQPAQPMIAPGCDAAHAGRDMGRRGCAGVTPDARRLVGWGPSQQNQHTARINERLISPNQWWQDGPLVHSWLARRSPATV
jgi:hypothetical protein